MSKTIEAFLSKCETLEAAATPGPWRVKRSISHRFCILDSDNNVKMQQHDFLDYAREDSAFVANARTAMPQLVQSLKIAMEALEKCDYAITEISELRRPGINVTTTAGEALASIEALLGDGK